MSGLSLRAPVPGPRPLPRRNSEARHRHPWPEVLLRRAAGRPPGAGGPGTGRGGPVARSAPGPAVPPARCGPRGLGAVLAALAGLLARRRDRARTRARHGGGPPGPTWAWAVWRPKAGYRTPSGRWSHDPRAAQLHPRARDAAPLAERLRELGLPAEVVRIRP